MSRHRFPVPRDPLAAPIHVWLFHRWLSWIIRVLFRVEVVGADRIPADGPFILIANHLSRFDPLILLGVVPLRPRVWFLAAAGPTIAIAWRRWLLRAMGGIIPIFEKTTGSGRRALRDAQTVLARGGRVGIFPEGRVGDREGLLQPVKPGAAQLSLRTGVPIVPVWIAGTQSVYWRKQIQIIINPPFYPPKGVSVADAAASLSGALQDCRDQAHPIDEDPNPRGRWINKLL